MPGHSSDDSTNETKQAVAAIRLCRSVTAWQRPMIFSKSLKYVFEKG